MCATATERGLRTKRGLRIKRDLSDMIFLYVIGNDNGFNKQPSTILPTEMVLKLILLFTFQITTKAYSFQYNHFNRIHHPDELGVYLFLNRL